MRGAPLALVLLAIALCAPPALGLGVSPAQRIAYANGTAQELSFRPVLSPSERGTLSARVEGDLAQYISATIEGEEGARTVVVRIPPLVGIAPGPHGQRIVLSLAPAAAQGEFSARTEVAARLTVIAPTPDAFLRAYWDVASDTGSGAVRATLTLENLGALPTTPEAAGIALADGSRTDTIVFLPLPAQIAPGASVRVDGRYDLSAPGALAPGMYDATLDVRYGGATIEERRRVPLGSPRVTVSSLALEREGGPIWPVQVEGALAWNEPVEVRARLFVDDAESPAIEERFNATGRISRTLYLDTARAGVPTQRVRVELSAGDSIASADASASATAVPPSRMWRWLAFAAAIACALAALLRWRMPPRAKPVPAQAPPQGPPELHL